jgi:hypothetical protein
MKTTVFVLLLLLFTPCALWSQGSTALMLTPEEVENYKRQVTDLVLYLEGTLNFIGDPNSPPREKETVIKETFLKIFKNDKVQVEDDLDENREVPLHKDVQAYLKDVDFFFRSALFKFHIVDIAHFTGDDGLHFFIVTFNRDLEAKAVTGDSLKSRKIRYMEVNLDLPVNELKIASIYTTRLNEREAMRHWWNTLPESWKLYFGRDVVAFDSVRLSDIVFFEDTLVLVKHSKPLTITDTLRGFGDRQSAVREEGFFYREIDTVYLNTQRIISSISAIMRIQEVDISGNISIRNLNPLSELTELTYVNCSNSLISGIHPLRNLNKLTTLDLSNTPVEDIASLQYSSSLKEINCSYTLVDNLKPLERLIQLTDLDISGLRADDFEFLRKLSKLEKLSMSHTRIADLEPLTFLTNLEELDVSNTFIQSLEPLSALINLKFLNCERTSVVSLEPLSGMADLAGLKISHTMIESLAPLRNHKNLRRIYWESEPAFPGEGELKRNEAIAFMRDNPQTLVIFEPEELLSNWKLFEEPWKEMLSEIVNLGDDPSQEELHAIFQIEKIDLGNSPITTLTPVRQLYNLRDLNVSGTNVMDFQPLSDAIELQVLNITNTSVGDLEFAGKLYKLNELHMEGTAVKSLGPIRGLSNLRLIYADHSGISDSEAFSFMGSNPDCIIIYKTDVMNEWWGKLPGGWTGYLAGTFNLDFPPATEQLHSLLHTEIIEIKGNTDIRSLEPLVIFNNLKTLKMANLDIGDLNYIAELNSLIALECVQMPVTSLTPVTSLVLLQSLNLMNTPLRDLRPVSGLTRLTSINISGTQVRNLKVLSKLTRLETVDLSNTRVRTLNPIRSLPDLKLVKCFNTRISQKDVDRFKANNPDCQVIYY